MDGKSLSYRAGFTHAKQMHQRGMSWEHFIGEKQMPKGHHAPLVAASWNQSSAEYRQGAYDYYRKARGRSVNWTGIVAVLCFALALGIRLYLRQKGRQ